MKVKTYILLKRFMHRDVGTIVQNYHSTPKMTAGLYDSQGKIVVTYHHIDDAIKQGIIKEITCRKNASI